MTPEGEIHKFTVDVLKAAARPDVIWAHVPNEGKRRGKTGAILKAKGMLPGFADFVFMMPSRLIGGPATVRLLELKGPDGEQSVAQLDFEARCEAIRAPYIVASTRDEVMHALHEFNVLRGRVN